MFIHFPMHIPKLRINPFSQWILRWAHSEPSSSVQTIFWIHLSVSIVSSKTLLFRSSSDSLLAFLGGSVSASLHMLSLCFPCSVHGSGLSFQQEGLLADFLSNWSIAWFITSWNSSMNSIRSALQLTSDKLSSSSGSSWSLLFSGGDCFVTSCSCAFPVWLLDSLLEPWLGPTISFFVSIFLIWTLLLYAWTNLAYLLLCP